MKTITLLPFMVLVFFGCAAGDIADLSAEDQEAHIKDELAQMDLGDPEALYNNELADDVEGKADGRRSRPPLIKYHDPRQPGAAVLNQKINTIRELLRVYYVTTPETFYPLVWDYEQAFHHYAGQAEANMNHTARQLNFRERFKMLANQSVFNRMYEYALTISLSGEQKELQRRFMAGIGFFGSNWAGATPQDIKRELDRLRAGAYYW